MIQIMFTLIQKNSGFFFPGLGLLKSTSVKKAPYQTPFLTSQIVLRGLNSYLVVVVRGYQR